MTDQEKIESLRHEHENPTEWRVRKAFLVKNFEKLDINRLECLSNCFANHELYGVGYPDKVMDEVRELSEGIVDGIFKDTN